MPTDPSSPGSPSPADEPTTEQPRAGDEPTTQRPRPDQRADQQPRAEHDATSAAPAPAPRRLLRSNDDRILSGVCGGLAKYFAIDPLIVRIAVVALTFVGGAGLVAYIAAAILVPADDGTGAPATDGPSRTGTIVAAIGIVLLGLAVLDGGLGLGLHAAWGALPFAVLLVLVAAIAMRVVRRDGEAETPLARIVKATILLVGGLVACSVLAVGGAWATAAGGGTAVAALVIALGVAMVVLALQRRHAAWLALPALALALPAGVVAAADVNLDGGVGQRSYTPLATTSLRPGYELGAGELILDLRRMDWPRNAPLTVNVRVGAGHALVLVPRDVCVQADVRAGAGYVGVLGEELAGADVSDVIGTVHRHDGRRLVLDGDVGLGALEVRHQRAGRDWGAPGGARLGNDASDPIPASLARDGCAGEPA